VHKIWDKSRPEQLKGRKNPSDNKNNHPAYPRVQKYRALRGCQRISEAETPLMMRLNAPSDSAVNIDTSRRVEDSCSVRDKGSIADAQNTWNFGFNVITPARIEILDRDVRSPPLENTASTVFNPNDV
jgi:hypothetical protein